MGVVGCGEKSEPEVDVRRARRWGRCNTTTTTRAAGAAAGVEAPEQADPEQEVNVAVVAVHGSACTRSLGLSVTRDYVTRPTATTKGCRAAVNKRGAFSVDVSQVKVNGKKATAKATPTAGPTRARRSRWNS